MEKKQEKTDAKTTKTERKPASAGRGAAEVAIVRIRGDVNRTHTIRQAFQMLRLGKKNVCVVCPDTPAVRGMIHKVKDYVTWGTIDEETRSLLNQKRTSAYPNVFFLAPPRKGYGKKGIKKVFAIGGGLGERHEKINNLIQRMI